MQGLRQIGLLITWAYLIINQLMLSRELRELQEVVIKLHERVKSSDARFSTHQGRVLNFYFSTDFLIFND